MAQKLSASWRGTVGCIKPLLRPGNLEAFIRLLPLGIGVLPLFIGNPKGDKGSSLEELRGSRMAIAKERIAQLVEAKVDLIHLESGPLGMVPGYNASEEIVKNLEKEFGVPIFTTGQSHVAALKALGIKRLVGGTYLVNNVMQKCADYIREAGFEVLGFETIHDRGIDYHDVGAVNPQYVYSFMKELFLKHKHEGVDGIYMLGSAWWPSLSILGNLEQDCHVPVVQAVTSRVWDVQKRLNVCEPIKGYGRLLEEMP